MRIVGKKDSVVAMLPLFFEAIVESHDFVEEVMARRVPRKEGNAS